MPCGLRQGKWMGRDAGAFPLHSSTSCFAIVFSPGPCGLVNKLKSQIWSDKVQGRHTASANCLLINIRHTNGSEGKKECVWDPLKYPWQPTAVLTCSSTGSTSQHQHCAQAMIACDWLNAQEEKLPQSYRADDKLCVEY